MNAEKEIRAAMRGWKIAPPSMAIMTGEVYRKAVEAAGKKWRWEYSDEDVLFFDYKKDTITKIGVLVKEG